MSLSCSLWLFCFLRRPTGVRHRPHVLAQYPSPSRFRSSHLPLDFCCSQFVVHRDAIRVRPKAFYAEVLRRIEALPDNDRDGSFEFGVSE